MTPRVLLDPNTENSGGGFVPPRATDVQATLSSPPAVQSVKETPPPESIKGVVFDTEGLGGDINYPEKVGEAEATKVSKEFENVVPKKEEPKVESKVEAKVEEQLPAKKTLGLNTPATKEEIKTLETTVARDYSIFPEEVREILKKSSNEAFAFTEKLYKQSKAQEEELGKYKKEIETIRANGVPEQWFDHPDAWRLAPESQQILGKIQRIEFEESFWAAQLEKIQNGEKFQFLRGYDKGGNPQYSELQEPSKQAESKFLLDLGKLATIKQQEVLRLNHHAQSFSSRYKEVERAAADIIQEEWPWHKDAKDPRQVHVKEFLDFIPPQWGKDQKVMVSALMYASLKQTQALLAEATKAQKVEQINVETKKIVEPSVRSPSVSSAQKSGVVNRNGSGNNTYTPPPTFDLAGMDR